MQRILYQGELRIPSCGVPLIGAFNTLEMIISTLLPVMPMLYSCFSSFKWSTLSKKL